MQELSAHHQSTAPNRAALLSKFKNSSQGPKIKPRGMLGPTPLSCAQERLWIMSQLEPDSPIYNMGCALELSGVLNTLALQQSLNEVMRRHEILRTRFITENNQAVQIVLPDSELSLSTLDLSGLEPSQQHRLFETCANEFILSPFDLSRHEPLRGMLVMLGKKQQRLLIAMHHIAADRWSASLFMQEVAKLYEAFDRGLPSPLPELGLHYADFALWQRAQTETRAKHLAYWTQKMHDSPPLLELPTDYHRPPVQSYKGDHYAFALPTELGEAVNALCKQHKATLFMVMAAAFTILLHRYTKSTDIALGYPSAGRSEAQTAGLIGFFVNTLVLRSRLQENSSFAGLLAQLREQALNDQAHQELAFGRLVEELNPVRNSGHAPVFQVMLAVQNVPSSEFKLPGLSVNPVALQNTVSQFDLTLFIEPRGAQLHAVFEYSTDLFKADSIARMAGHLQTLLADCVSRPEKPLKHLALLTPPEQQRILHDWNTQIPARQNTEHPFIHQYVEAQAKATPNKTALVFDAKSLSYAGLEQRANQLAHHLISQGVRPESRVGVCAVRSPELIVGLLAVLKAGAAYVPLDPAYPEERLEHMLNDAGIAVLLIQSGLRERFKDHAAKRILLDQSYENYSPQAPELAASPENTAYIIYTSGSTGLPKGVLVSHRNLLHSTLARTDFYEDALACFLLLSSFAFDSSVAGIFWTLSQGGRLCLPHEDELSDIVALRRLVNQQQVSHLLALPSFYSAIVSEGPASLLHSLKAVIVAGEACSTEIVASHHEKLPQVKLYNEYGPTEATVWSSVYECSAAHTGAPIPIGKAIAGVQLYLLDDAYEPVPVGVCGELYIGGRGITQGYLNQPGLSAEKFIPNPFSGPGQRLYKSGDLARFLADGNIEFLGRTDNQVKIRGYRIELGEIEACLLQHAKIKESAVVVSEEKAGDKRLVAYIVCTEGLMPELQDIKAHLKQTLPDYMVPAQFIPLAKLPLSANGKLDKKALPSPEQNLASDSREIKPASNATEAALLELWREVLGLETISVSDNFFELGGHSLSAIQLRSRLNEQFAIDMPVKVLFESPSIELIAKEILALQAYQHSDVLEKLLLELEQLSDEEASNLLAEQV